MSRLNWLSALNWLLAAFFAIGAFGNMFASETILADYQRWGYPDWFHWVTGAVELATSLILLTRFRLWGAVLGSSVMASAVATVVYHGEYGHAVPPLVVLGLCLTAAALFARQGRR
ncbi:DoxX family protein [Rhizobium sp. G187]|uniref:DoxX family protein n=1 Tax=Rhizobium sp. G187 TaxID=3451352 RepID=UPI003EE43274